jgi:hypothetical protein
MEMRWTLLLLINLFTEVSKQSPPNKSTLIEKIIETAGTDFTDTEVRVKTGQIVAEILAGSPWDLQIVPGSTKSQADHSICAVLDGMVKWTRQINRIIDKHVPAVEQKRYDVEEAWSSDEEDEGPIPGYEPDEEQHNKSPIQSPQSIESAGEKPRTRNNNIMYPRGLFWTPKESLALLKQYQNAPPHADGKPATHQQVADLHNASFFPDGEYARTKVALQQQLKHLVKGGRAGIEAKIAELEGEADGDGENKQLVSAFPHMKHIAAFSKKAQTTRSSGGGWQYYEVERPKDARRSSALD